jgi:hypothetical protein
LPGAEVASFLRGRKIVFLAKGQRGDPILVPFKESKKKKKKRKEEEEENMDAASPSSGSV